MKINLPEVYVEITKREAGATQVNIAQVADVMAAFGDYLRSLSLRKAICVCLAIRKRAGLQSKSLS